MSISFLMIFCKRQAIIAIVTNYSFPVKAKKFKYINIINKQNGPGSSSKLHKCRCCEKSKTPESTLILLPKAIAGKRSQRLIFNAKSPQRTPTAWRDFTLIVRGRGRVFEAHWRPHSLGFYII